MKWYTLDNGVLCLGTDNSQYANFHVATDVVVDTKIETSLDQSHIDLIGLFPEDWHSEKNIERKINKAAKHFFGFANNKTTNCYF